MRNLHESFILTKFIKAKSKVLHLDWSKPQYQYRGGDLEQAC